MAPNPAESRLLFWRDVLLSRVRSLPTHGSARQTGKRKEDAMKNVSWLLFGLAALAFVVGTLLAFTHSTFLLSPQGYWRGAIGFLLFTIALRMMEERK
jgi:hypothetical protein